MPGPPNAKEETQHDAELVARVRAGDAGALETIFLTYSTALRDFAVRYTGSRDEAAELVQDVFLTIWRTRAAWRVESSLKAYLFRAARNAALDRLRHERVARTWREEVARAQDAAVGAPSAPAADAPLLNAELGEAIERALAALPERRRMAILLRWRDGLSYAEIAEVMEISIRTVENTVANAMRDLRAVLGPWLDRGDR